MTPELIGVVAVGVALAGLVLVSNRETARVLRAEIKAVRAEIKAEREERKAQFESVRAEIAAMRADMAELRERMARIEGMFEGFLRREREPTPAAA